MLGMNWFKYFALIIVTSVFAQTSKDAVSQMALQADVQINGSRPWDIQVHNDAFYDRVIKDQSLGLGESYMLGWWDSQNVDESIYKILRAQVEQQFSPTWSMKWAYIKAKIFNRQSKKASMQVIDQHYQLGNDLYEKMLDPTMTYSCGYWKNASNLHEAQLAKYDLIAKKLQIKPGMRVLDIGCGWGGFAKFIAENYQAKVVAVTLSSNQAEYARKVCAGLDVEIQVQDYRDINEKFDRVVEIGMFEHVGVKNYRTFMQVAHNCLKDDGMLMLHTIGSNSSHISGDPWIDKYIFPGGQLPSISQIGNAIEGLFIMEDWHNFSTDYDKTLMAWHKNFNAHWDELKSNYQDLFYRMWNYYLLSCAGTFRARNIQLWQVVLSKTGVIGGYQSVR